MAEAFTSYRMCIAYPILYWWALQLTLWSGLSAATHNFSTRFKTFLIYNTLTSVHTKCTQWLKLMSIINSFSYAQSNVVEPTEPRWFDFKVVLNVCTVGWSMSSFKVCCNISEMPWSGIEHRTNYYYIYIVCEHLHVYALATKK